jgi:hypothetical protein
MTEIRHLISVHFQGNCVSPRIPPGFAANQFRNGCDRPFQALSIPTFFYGLVVHKSNIFCVLLGCYRAQLVSCFFMEQFCVFFMFMKRFVSVVEVCEITGLPVIIFFLQQRLQPTHRLFGSLNISCVALFRGDSECN